MLNIMYNAGVRVFSNSWGTTGNNYDSMAVQVDTFMYNHPDALVLFSAGNSGENGLEKTVNSPSTNKNGVSVGASLNDHDSWLAYETETEDYYGIEAVAGFSSQGPTAVSNAACVVVCIVVVYVFSLLCLSMKSSSFVRIFSSL